MQKDKIVDISKRELGIGTAKNGVLFVSSKIVAAAITLILLIFLTHILNPTDYGIYIIAVAFTSVLGMAGNFGLGTSLRKKIPESNNKIRINKLVSNGYFAAIVISLVISIIGILISNYLAVHIYHNPNLTLPFMVASITVFLTVIFNTTNAILVGINKIKEASIGNITYTSAQLVIVSTLVLLGYSILGALIGIAAGLFLGFAVMFAYMIKNIKYRFERPSSKILREIISFSIPIMLSNIAVVGIANFAIDFLGIFAVIVTVGSFGAAFKLGRIFEVLLASTTYILLPTFSKVLGSKTLSGKISSIFDNSIYYMLLIMLPLLVFLIAISNQITRLLFTSAYPSAAFYFSIISIGIAAQVIGSFAGTLIISYGDSKRFMKYQITVVITELILLIITTPIIKAYGVLLSLFIVGPILLDMLYINSLSKQFKIHMKFGRLLRLLLSSVILWIILTVMNIYVNLGYVNIIIGIIMTLLIYPPLVVVTGSIKQRNIAFLKELAGQMHKIGYILNILIRYTEIFQVNQQRNKKII